MKKHLLALAFALSLAAGAHAQNAITLPYAVGNVADIGNGPIKVRVTQGNASIFTAQGSGTGSTSGSSTSLTLTGTPTTPPIVGGLISGNGITSGTTVTAYNGTTGITLSAAMTVPASTALSWGATCPATPAGRPTLYIPASVMADYYLLYTQARVCAVSPGGPANTILILPIFYDQTTPGGGGGSTLPSLPSGQIWVGSAGAVATARTISGSGDCTTSLSNVGVFTYVCTKTNGVNFSALATLTPGTGVATALGNTAGGAGGFALVGTTPPTGAAGGDLIGTYPNPTLATVNANVGVFGSVTSCVTFTVNAKGLITAASQATCTPALGSITGLGTGVGTALAINIGSAGAPVLFNGAGGTPSSITLTNATGCAISSCVGGLGTGVATAAGTAVSTAGGFPVIVAKGTVALGTSAISANTCGTAATATATGVANTDIVDIGFQGDPTATTGYLPTASVSVVPYFSTTNTIAFKQCNYTTSSITPSALTLNWSVRR